MKGADDTWPMIDKGEIDIKARCSFTVPRLDLQPEPYQQVLEIHVYICM